MGFPARVVCDPVFLLKPIDWEVLIKNAYDKKKYIFVYITHLSASVQAFIERCRRETGYKVVFTASGPKQALKHGRLQVQTPETWLRLLHNAEFVITNSFHATAFSVMFHKKFFTVVNGDKTKGINVRMNEFLNMMGLCGRIFAKLLAELDLSEIDYSGIDEKLNTMREDSLQFLHQNLEAAYQIKKEQEAISQ